MLDYVIAPSLLSADWACLGEETQKVLSAGADWIHIDVMDNHYVPNLTFGPQVCKALRAYGIKAHFDIHLMVEPVESLIQAFAKAGATSISFHPEATRHVDRCVNLIRECGCMAGLAFNPATPLTHLNYLLDKLDLVLLMTVNPGFAGQAFLPNVVSKIQEVRVMMNQVSHPIRLEVDGGLNDQTLRQVAKAGADTFVAGTAIFKSPDYQKAIGAMRKALLP